jgi:hypothetical protein
MAVTRADVLRHRIDLDDSDSRRVLTRYNKSVQQSADKVARSNKKAEASFRSARLEVARMRNITLLTAFTISSTVVAFDRLSKQAEKIANLSTAFDTLGGRIDASAGFLSKLRRATRNAVTDLELMRLANNAVVLGVAKSEDQFVRLAEGAVRLGRAVGLEATPAVESLVTGIGRQSRMMLDNLGIIVRVEEANTKYAAAIGKVVGELTDGERKTAFATAAIEAMDTALVGVTAETGRFSDAWNVAKTSVANAVNSILEDVNKLPGATKGTQAAFLNILGQSIPLPGAFGAGGIGSALIGGVPSPEDLVPSRQPRAAEIVALESKIEEIQKRIAAIQAQQLETAERKKTVEERVTAELAAQKELREFIARSVDAEAEIRTKQLTDAMTAADTPTFDALIGDVEGPKAKVNEFAMFMREEFAFAAASFGGGLAAALTGAKVDIKQMIQSLLAGLAQAIVQAKLFAAIMAAGTVSTMGAGGGSGLPIPGNILPFSRGGIVGAQRGVLLRGGVPGRDSIPILAQAGEMVLPRAVSDLLVGLLVGAARNSQRAGTHSPDPLSASRAAPSINVSLNVSGVTDSEVSRRIENAPQAIAAAVRRVIREGIR